MRPKPRIAIVSVVLIKDLFVKVVALFDREMEQISRGRRSFQVLLIDGLAVIKVVD